MSREQERAADASAARPSLAERAGRLALGFTIALVGALLAVWIGIPLPWLLGALLLTGLTRMAGIGSRCAKPVRNAGQWVIGTSLGLYFTPLVARHIIDHTPLILFGMVYALILGLLGTWVLQRFAGLDFRTAWFSAAIGGASEMVNLAEHHGARADRVVSVHSMRVLIVVVLVPFAFQWWGVAGLDPDIPGPRAVDMQGLAALFAGTCATALLFRRLRLPNAWVLGPMLFALLLTVNEIEWSALPQWVSWAGQLMIGWSLGDRYRPDFFRAAPRLLSIVAILTSLMIASSFALGSLLAPWVGLPAPTLILGLSPGGIAEMTITAKVLQLGVPLVTALQVTRMVFVVLTVGPLYRWQARRRSQRGLSS